MNKNKLTVRRPFSERDLYLGIEDPVVVPLADLQAALGKENIEVLFPIFTYANGNHRPGWIEENQFNELIKDEKYKKTLLNFANDKNMPTSDTFKYKILSEHMIDLLALVDTEKTKGNHE